MEKINRDKLQEDAAKLWLESDRFNTLVLGTGFGKSKVAMLVMDALFKSGELTKNSKILLLSDSEGLRDVNWKADFEKWGFGWMWELIVSECYQTAYKWKDTEWDFALLDEIDFALTEEYIKSITNNKHKMLLGLTGYVAEDKAGILELTAPSLVEYTTQDAQKDGILNKTQVTFITFDLSRNKHDIEVKYKKGGVTKSFKQSENDAYDYIENKCNTLWGKINRMRQDQDVVLGLDVKKVDEYTRLNFQYKMAANKRKDLLYKCIASVNTCKDLIELLLKNNENKVITFSMLTSQADLINTYTYHGKNKKENQDFLEKLSKGDIRSLGVCKAVNRGRNISGLNSLVMESFDGSTTQFTQRHGRGTRLGAGEIMNLYILLPYYYKKVKSPENHGGNTHIRKPTQAVKWAQNMLKGFEIENPIVVRKGIGKNDWRRINTETEN